MSPAPGEDRTPKTARDRLAERLAAAPAEPAAAGEKPAKPAATRPSARTKRIRRTLDLSVARHHALNAWCEEQAVALGRPRMAGQYVLDELVGLLLTDETTARKVTAALRKRFEEE